MQGYGEPSGPAAVAHFSILRSCTPILLYNKRAWYNKLKLEITSLATTFMFMYVCTNLFKCNYVCMAMYV